jgi:hypothetical protein
MLSILIFFFFFFFIYIYTINFFFFFLVALGSGVAQAPGLAGLTPEPALSVNNSQDATTISVCVELYPKL